MKTYSIKNLPIISAASTSIIYKLDDNKVIKAFYSYVPDEQIDLEFKKIKIAHAYSDRACDVFEKIQLDDGRKGLILDFLHGQTLYDVLVSDQKNWKKVADELIYIFFDLHDIKDNKTSYSFINRYLDAANYVQKQISKQVSEAFKEIISHIPKDNTFIHGDFHIKNIFIKNSDQSYVMIDLPQMGYGHPIFELLSFILAHHFGPEWILHKKSKANTNSEYFNEAFKCFDYVMENGAPETIENACPIPISISYDFYKYVITKLFKIKNEQEFNVVDIALKLLCQLSIFVSSFMSFSKDNMFISILKNIGQKILDNKDRLISFLDQYCNCLIKSK